MRRTRSSAGRSFETPGNGGKRIANLLTHHYFKLAGEENRLFLAHTVGEERKFKITAFERLEDLSAESSDQEIAEARAQKLTMPD